MTGTPWLSVHHNGAQYGIPQFGSITVEDRESDLYEQVRASQHDFHGKCQLSYFSLGDLGLPHGSTTPNIFDAAFERGAKIIPYGIALLTLIQHPFAFRNGLFKRLFGLPVPFESCLLGIKPLTGKSGRMYIVELSENHFRFRHADEDERWGNYEYWVFAS